MPGTRPGWLNFIWRRASIRRQLAGVTMGNKLVRTALAEQVARRFAAEQLQNAEAAAAAFAEEALTAEERLVAHAELRRIAQTLIDSAPE